MIHESTWLGGMRVMRWRRLMAPVGFLVACVLLAGLPASASASAPEMRGEWELTVTASSGQSRGTALIKTEADPQGKFASSSALFRNTYPGSFSGTLEGSNASVTAIAEAQGSAPEVKFTSTTMTVDNSGSAPSMSGSGELIIGGQPVPGGATLVATRIKTYKEIEEREAKEKKEREEREEQEARENVRGEWELVMNSVAGQTKGIALITKEADPTNKFESSKTLIEGVLPGSFSGTLEGSKASITVTAQAAETSTFTSTTMTIDTSGGSMSMSGSGMLTADKVTVPATMVATRIKTYNEIKQQEAKEKAEQEAKAKAEQEAKEQAEREAKAKAEQEAKVKAEQEAKAKAEQEAKVKAEQEAKAKAEKEAIANQSATTLLSAEPAAKTFSVSGSGSLALKLTNPNASPVQGHVTLVAAGTSKASSATAGHKKSTKALSLGAGSFSISANADETVKISLSHGGRTELARHKTLRVTLTIVTESSGKPSVSKLYTLTLHAAVSHHKH